MPLSTYSEVLFDEPMMEFVARNHTWAVKIKDRAPRFDAGIVDRLRRRFDDYAIDVRQIECGPGGIPCWCVIRWVSPVHEGIFKRWRKHLVNSGFLVWPAFASKDQLWEVKDKVPLGYSEVYSQLERRIRYPSAFQLMKEQAAERRAVAAEKDRAVSNYCEDMDKDGKAKGYVGHHQRTFHSKKTPRKRKVVKEMEA